MYKIFTKQQKYGKQFSDSLFYTTKVSTFTVYLIENALWLQEGYFSEVETINCTFKKNVALVFYIHRHDNAI